MSVQKNLAGLYVPVREQRQTLGTISTPGEIVHQLNGDDSTIIYINNTGSTLTATFDFTATVDGTNFFPIPAVPYYGTGGTIPSFAQPLLVESFSAATLVTRTYCLKTSQLKAVRFRATALTGGSVDVTLISDANRSLHPAISDGRPTTLYIGATAAVGVAATATLPAVSGLRHYIDFIAVQRVASAALTVGAGTTTATVATNLPAALVGGFAFGQDAALQGTSLEVRRDFGGTGLATNAAGTATVLTMPATTGVIWRIEIAYRLGI